MLLCRAHHVAVHEGGFSVLRDPDGGVTFLRPDGVRLDPAPPVPMWALFDPDPLGPTMSRLQEAGMTIDVRTCMPRDGQRIDICWAIDALRIPASDLDGSSPPHRRDRHLRCP